MPPINRYKCDSCDLQLPSGWGGCMYVIDESGNRIVCKHPGEENTVSKVILAIANFKEKESIEQLIEERTGYNSYCFCHHCLKTCKLDLGDAEKSTKSWRYHYHAIRQRDKRECPHCGANDILTVFELIGNNCPKCLKGKIVEIETGIWS